VQTIWFVWNGWGNVHGRNAKCCDHCSHFGGIMENGICDLHKIQCRPDLVCDEFKWDKNDKSIWDD
jgi:hypothetical protein